jgi:hypothetical protein
MKLIPPSKVEDFQFVTMSKQETKKHGAVFSPSAVRA